MLNSGRIISSLLAVLGLRTFSQYLIAFWSRPEAANGVTSDKFVRPIVPDKCIKFCDPCLNRSREIPLEAVGGGIFEFFDITYARK